MGLFDIYPPVTTPPPPLAQPPIPALQPPAADATEPLGLRRPPVGGNYDPDHEARRPEEDGHDGGDGQEPHEDAVRVEQRGDPWGPDALAARNGYPDGGDHYARGIHEDSKGLLVEIWRRWHLWKVVSEAIGDVDGFGPYDGRRRRVIKGWIEMLSLVARLL